MSLRAPGMAGVLSMAAWLAVSTMASAGPLPHVPYDNGRWGFRLDYPDGWSPSYGDDGAGILLVKDGQAMAVGALYAREDDQGRPALFCHPSGIDPLIALGRRKVTNKRVLSRRTIYFRGRRSCWSMLAYSIGGRPYRGRYFSLLRDGLQYDFSVECTIRDCANVNGQFTELLRTFRFGKEDR